MFNPHALDLGTRRSCIRELYEYGCQRAAMVGRENVFDYSLGNPSVPSPPELTTLLLETIRETDSVSLHGYTSAAGDYSTRAAIAKELNDRYGWNATPEHFFLGCGAAPELSAVFQALTTPGSEFLGLAPYFPEYPVFAQTAGATFRAVPPALPNFQIPLEAVEAALTPQTAALVINSPNNPSGVVYTREVLTKLADILRKKSREYRHPIYLISDEPYRELVYDGADVPFLPAIYPDTVVCYSYSKSLSLPGERIGYIYVPEAATDSKLLYAAIAGAARAKGHVCAPSLWQKVIAKATHLRPNLKAYDENRLLLWKSLTAMGYEAPKPQGAFYLFVKAPGGDAVAFSEKAKAKDLLLVPGDGFGCPGYFRMCYCVEKDMIQRSLPIFEALIQDK